MGADKVQRCGYAALYPAGTRAAIARYRRFVWNRAPVQAGEQQIDIGKGVADTLGGVNHDPQCVNRHKLLNKRALHVG